MIHSSTFNKAIKKFKNEGIRGVCSAVLKRARPFYIGMLRKNDGGGVYHVLYVIGCNEGESKRYRVFNIMEVLIPFGVTSRAVSVEELRFIKPEIYTLVVFFRCEMGRFTQNFLEKCKTKGIPTIFDVDDLIFDETIVHQIAAFQELNDDYKSLYLSSVSAYQEMLRACDGATASTKYLCNYINTLTGGQAFHIPNGINHAQIRTSSSLIPKETKYTIGFLSGSKTHNKDFLIAAQAVANILLRYNHVNLTVIGYLDLPDCLKAYRTRITMLPFMNYIELMKKCSELYMVIIPLEFETAFCQAKSELKYFEQALLGIPVIASPTEVFRGCIEHRINGMLAETSEQWERSMEELLINKSLYTKIAVKARQQIREVYYPDRIGLRAKKVYDYLLNSQALKKMDNKCLRVAFVIPEPFKGAGGHRNIFRIVRRFTELGHRVTIYTHGYTGRFLSAKALERFIAQNFFDTGADFVIDCNNIAPCDLLIATIWHTAYVVEKFKHRCALPCYFIQDFEPYFYPMGEEYVKAYNSYKLGFSHVASGKWAAEMVEKISNRECPYFVFPLQRDIYHKDDSVQRSERQVVFFARPQMPRRTFMLGVEALKLLKNKMPEVNIIFYGESRKLYGDYGFTYENLGLLEGPLELANLYQKSTVGVCFSVTNPSLVPYEMMACGLPVMDVDFNGNSASYNGYDTVLMAEPYPQALCNSIYLLITDRDEAEARRQNGFKLTDTMPNEKEIGDFVINTWINELEGLA